MYGYLQHFMREHSMRIFRVTEMVEQRTGVSCGHVSHDQGVLLMSEISSTSKQQLQDMHTIATHAGRLLCPYHDTPWHMYQGTASTIPSHDSHVASDSVQTS